MRLSKNQKLWNRFARTDPFWAVLTDDGKRGNQWTEEEFFRTGQATVASDLKKVRAHHPELRFGSALDFGCGVGRLSQALAEHFHRVVGVDISEEMLRLARHYNRHPDRVDYVLNTSDHLGQLADNQFDFVYSLITLQHMEPKYARAYIAEFVRVAAPGGLILFQVPSLRRDRRKSRPFTLWPDTLVKRIVRDIRRKITFGPMMEMNEIPPAEVASVLSGAGADILTSYDYDAAGKEMESRAYLARKR